jgi:Fe-S oxidoreductase
MEMAASPKLSQNRTGWIKNGLKTKTKGDVLYFVGCLPYYQDFFGKDFEFSPIDMAGDTVKILNFLGIEPVVAKNERCCGHDLYWLGRLDKFDELGKLNLREIADSGAKTVVTACPECAYTLKTLYMERLGKSDFEVKHVAELVSENIGRFDFTNLDKAVTFQDPCRLGRYLNTYDQPRDSMKAIPGLELLEMPHNRAGGFCCGTTNWMNCDSTSKQIQQSRLREAKSTGAGTIVTACPKCQIHFRCAGCGEEADRVDIEITDFVSLIASAMNV